MRDRPGMSAFALEDGVVYHTYSTYARGLDGLWGAYQWLDRAPKGRNETGVWWRRHDEYDKPSLPTHHSRSASGRLAMQNTPPIVSRQDWEAAREQLLTKEKAVFRARDALAAERRRMPWMAIEKAYEFVGPTGKASLIDLFEGRRQLIVYRAFFEPGVFGWPEHACRGCSLGADQVSHLAHLNARDTTLAYVSRAPQADIARLKARMGWKMPWYTITDSFDADFGVDEWHGHNVFFRDGDRVFRTYFINSRGDEAMGTVWSYLDATAARAPGSVGGFAGGLPPESAVQVVELARQLRRREVGRPAVGQGVGRRRGRLPQPRGGREAMSEAYASGGFGRRGCRDDIRAAAARGAADWLGLAAAPTFAIMALLTATGGEPQLLCSAAHLGSPLGGMVPMYLLMSAFPFGPMAEADLRPAKPAPAALTSIASVSRGSNPRNVSAPSAPWIASSLRSSQ